MLASCSLGGVGGSGPGEDVDELPAAALCEAQLTLSGTLTPPGAPPPAEHGCVPEGTWTIDVAIGGANDCGDVPMAGTYIYEVVGQGHSRVITLTNGSGEETALNIHAGGNGECEGSFEHIWPAGDGEFHVALLKPWFEAGSTTIQGTGTYQLWTEHP